MKRIYLDGKWQMTGGGYSCFGEIPGSVYSFLHIDNEILPDPHFRDNEDIYLALAEEEFSFGRRFVHEATGNRVALVFEGLDTLCSVYLNGRLVAETENMHIRYSFDVTELLRDGENEICVVCHPIAPFMRENNARARLFGAVDCMEGYPHVRKAHSMMGWDWGPRLPDAGIWRSVYLLEKDSAEIVDVDILQRHEGGKVFLTPMVECDGGEIEIRLVAPDGAVTLLEDGRENEVKAPKLWMPNGLGEQNLYEISAVLRDGGKICDEKKLKIGLRDMKLIRKADEFGESFYHEINGVDMFAMGADYVPEDNIFSRITPERTRELLMHCKNCNFNAIRLWGGGYYPDDFFFDICDELGLVVFCDLAFACSVYDPDEKMMESISLEVEQNLRRIRHHACLGLICGNNEIEWHFHEYVAISGREDGKRLTDVYLDLFERRLPKIVERVAPQLAYVPSSPTSKGAFDDPNGESFGDCHDWDSDHVSARRRFQRYVSEFGFQSLPDIKTIESFTYPEDRADIFTPVMAKHQRSGGGNELILAQLGRLFDIPGRLEDLVYLSQLLQAESVGSRVEHLRRHRGRCMGALYWQLNDIWPVTSWASIDYFGRYKALQYAAKRFFAPVLISCEEIGEMQIECGLGHELGARLAITNDTLSEVSGEVIRQICDSEGRVIKEGREAVTVPPLSAKWLENIDVGGVLPEEHHLRFALVCNGDVVSEGHALFVAPKNYKLIDPALEARIEGDEIVVKASAFAKAVQIYSEESDFILSDNFFDMDAGEKRIRILSGRAEKIELRSLFDIE